MPEQSKSAIHSAIGEIQRTAIDALRGLGLSFNLADRITHALTWAEAVDGSGLRFIRENEARIRAAIPHAFGYTERMIGSLPCVMLDATGKSSLESAPRAFDLADAQAQIGGIGLVMIRRTFGSVFFGEFVTRSMERGFGTLLLCQPRGLAGEVAHERCVAILGLIDGTMKVAMGAQESAAGRSNAMKDFEPLLGKIVGESIAGELADAVAHDAGLSDVTLVSFRASADKMQVLSKSFDHCASVSHGWQVDDQCRNRWRNAVEKGFDIDPLDWKFLFSLVAQTRVVTSERSQSQAG